MKNELLTQSDGAKRLEQIGLDLALVYQVAFAGEPWNENSRCATSGEFFANSPGELCSCCGQPLTEAYNKEELVFGWQNMLENENAMVYVSYDDTETATCVTIARPTTTEELWQRKYSDVPEMQQWLIENLPPELVWIEDTFADRERQPSGNLRERSRVLGAIAARYSQLPIATRTKAPQIVAATVKAAPGTALYQGSYNIAYKDNFDPTPYIQGEVPDQRTLLVVDREKL